jgi:hypothetical protein
VAKGSSKPDAPELFSTGADSCRHTLTTGKTPKGQPPV